MNIFISWSKSKSLEYAKILKELLESMYFDVFLSEESILGGEPVQKTILQHIANCDKLIICFTRDNKKSPWLLFEAGYALGIGKTVVPILFDKDSNWHSWIDNPMNFVREIEFDSSIFPDALIKALCIKSSDMIKREIKYHAERMEKIKDKYRVVDIKCEDFVEKLINDRTFVTENPSYKNKTAYFLSGFESFELYKIIIDTFMYTGKYLWIYGRKNMKLFSGNFSNFFDYLKEKISNDNINMMGIDFKCLFLDPNCPEVEKSHIHPQLLKTELKTNIERANIIFKDTPRLRQCFRLYSGIRDEIIIRLDNCIIYAHPHFDDDGRPQLLTNMGFEVFSVDSEKGQKCIKKFQEVWKHAKPML